MINFFLSSPSVRRRPFEQNRIIEIREEKKNIGILTENEKGIQNWKY